MLPRIGLVALVLFGGFIAPRAQADGQTGRPLIVAVGIDKFQDPQIKPRKNAEADARAIVEWYLAKDHLGVEPDRVKLLLGSGPVKDAKYPTEKATKDNILAALKWLESNAKKDDFVVLAIFGQGAPIGERSCYFGVDSTYKNRTKDAVSSSDIDHVMEKMKSQRVVSMVDVHFLGFDPGEEKLPDVNGQKIYKEFLGLGDENKEEEAPSRVIFMAGAASKLSLDLDKHGVFAQALLDGLNGKADAEGYEADGNITVAELAKHVRKAVPDLARVHGKTKEEKEQRAGVLEAQSADFVVGYYDKVRVQAFQRLKKFEALAKEKNLDLKITEEGHDLLTRMPKLEAKQKLRKAYQQLADGKIDVAEFQKEREEVLETMKLSELDAGKYALTIMRAANLIEENYFKKVAKEPLVENAVTAMYKAINENLPSDLKDRLAKVKQLSEAELLRLLTDARQHLGTREDLGKGQDITYSLRGMFGKLDPYTGYVPPEIVRRFRDENAGSFKGVGVQVRQNDAREELQVITPIYGSPAYKAGLKANDIITTIISEVDPQTGKAYDKPQVTPTKGLSMDEAIKKIQGKAGTKVKLVVEREGSDKPIEFTLVRAQIEVESVLGHKRGAKDAWNYVIDPENKICYVRLTGFSENTYGELEKVMKRLYQEGVKGFILDLRFNPGGLLESSIKIADLFIDDGLIVTVRHRDGSETSYVGRSDGSYTAFPMVCLINSGSASASEIVSAALQDHGRAIIMGSRSFGKGSVQHIHGFENKSIVKVTSSTFWRPTGRNLNKSSTKGREQDEWGVLPDSGFGIKLSRKEEDDLYDHLREAEIIRAGPPSEAKGEFRDLQIEQAIEYLRGQVKTASRPEVASGAENR